MTKILLVPAHHKTTPGKRSPDERILEYAYSRELIEDIIERLKGMGYDAINPIPETEKELSLGEQCRIVNKIYDECSGDCFCITPHLNAAGNGSKWMNARGWSAFIYRGAGEKTKELARSLTKAAENEGLKIRYEYPEVPYWTSGFYICKNTKPSTVLTENLFQDNLDDVEFLLSPQGKEAIVNLHVAGILEYLNKEEKK